MSPHAVPITKAFPHGIARSWKPQRVLFRSSSRCNGNRQRRGRVAAAAASATTATATTGAAKAATTAHFKRAAPPPAEASQQVEKMQPQRMHQTTFPISITALLTGMAIKWKKATLAVACNAAASEAAFLWSPRVVSTSTLTIQPIQPIVLTHGYWSRALHVGHLEAVEGKSNRSLV